MLTVSKRRPQPPAYLQETEKIKENAKKYGDKVHKFTAAKWTHPNGHPRCLMCGQEQSFSPECNRDATPEEEAAVTESWGFDLSAPVSKEFDPNQPRDPRTGRWVDIVPNMSRAQRLLQKELDAQGESKMSPVRGVINHYGSHNAIARSDSGIEGAISYEVERRGKRISINSVRAMTKRGGIGRQMLMAVAAHTKELPNGSKYEMKVYGAVSSAKAWYMLMGADFVDWSSIGSWSPEKVQKLANGEMPEPGTYEMSDGSILSYEEYIKMNPISKAKNPLWDGDGRQLPGQPRGPKGRWSKTGGAVRRLVRSIAEAAKLPGEASLTQRNKANDFAKKNYPDNEAKYAGLIVRLAGKGKAQDPTFRGQMSERYDIPPNRLVEIENEMYDQMWPRKVRQKKEDRKAQTAGAQFLSAAQSRALIDVGARSQSIRLVPDTDRKNLHPDRMVKATSGPHKGSYVRISSSGDIKKVPARSVDKMKRESKKFWDERDARSKASESKRRSAPKPVDEKSFLIREEREARRERAKKILREMGMNASDTFNQYVITGDRDLLMYEGSSGKGSATPESTRLKELRSRQRQASRLSKENPGDRFLKDEAKKAKEAVAAHLEKHPELKVQRRKKATPLTRNEKVAIARLDREMEDWRAGRTSEPASQKRKPAKKVTAKKPTKKIVVPKPKKEAAPKESAAPKKKAAKKTSAPRAARAPKREPLTFDMARGLPLEPGKPKNRKKYQAKTKDESPVPSLRKATEADKIRLFGIDPKTGKPKKPQKGHENIRVPVGKVPTNAFGAFTYMYDHHYVKDQGDTVKRNKRKYTPESEALGQKYKYDRIARMADAMPEFDARLKRDAVKDDTAGAVAVMRILGMRPSSDKGETKVRIGDKLDSKGNPMFDSDGAKIGEYEAVSTFGATTMQRQHVTIKNGVVEISLTGKAAHEIKIRTDDPVIVAIFKARLNKKGKPTDKLFNTTETKTTKYIKETFPDASNKDLRTYVATEIARRTIESLPVPRNIAEFKHRVLDVTETTANQLQHQRTQSKNSYISPTVFKDWADGIDMDFDLFMNPIKGKDRKMLDTAAAEKYREKIRAEEAHAKEMVENYISHNLNGRRKKK